MNKGEMLKYSILQMAMKGELVPSDDQDDSTDNILKKINIEKEDLIFKKRLKRDKKESIINRKNDQFYEKKDKEKYCINSEIDFSVPKSWKLMRLGSLVKLLNPLISKGQNFPYLNAKFLRNQVDPMIKDSGRYIPEGTNIILVDGENSGEVFTTFCEGYLGSTFRELFIPKVLNADFVLYFIESYKEYLKNSKKSAAIPHLNKEIFNNLLIGIPPLEEQKRIVEKIEEVLPLIEKYGNLIDELEHIYK
ncbi:MAG: restriction endonuclease subunit S [Methanobrevibacter sp.]|jgi:type I restriction enzyme S subunit|nr:restriction endonuclease subunit S [Candidatus Methanovirga procula]